MSPASVSERLVSALLIGLACVVFVALLLAVPAFLPSFDEAKYLGIGSNVLAGRGVVSVYGPFLDHSPLWAVTLAAADVVAGIDPLSWGHVLDGIAGAGLILLVAWFGWRFRPAAGALGATVVLGFTYLHDLTRTARLDVPAAALALLFVAVGIAAIRRDSLRWGVLAGAVFAIAFLVKEIALPFAPVPLIAGLIAGRPLAALARVSGAMLLTAALGTAWWFVVFASYTRQVYRLGLPAWTLVPIAAIVVVIGVSCLAARRIGATATARSIADRVSARVAPAVRARWRMIVGWTLALGWFLVLDVAFARNQATRGLSFLSLAQWQAYVAVWLTPITVAAGCYALGGLIAIWSAARGHLGPGAMPVVDLTVAAVCSMPLVLLVIAVGEPPRNYLAQIGVVVALASCGWVWLAVRLASRVRPRWERARGSRWVVTLGVAGGSLVGAGFGLAIAIGTHLVTRRTGLAIGVAVGATCGWATAIIARRTTASAAHAGPLAGEPLRPTRRVSIGVIALIVPLVLSTAILADHVRAYRGSATGAAQLAAVRTVTDWIDANVPSGSTIAFGSYLGYEMSLALDRPYTITQIAQEIARFTTAGPLGIAVSGKPPADDWVSVDTAPRNVAEFQAFRASVIANKLRSTGATYWIYTTGTPTSAETLIPALEAATGLTEVARWTFPYTRAAGGGSGVLTSYVFKVEPGVAVDPGTLFIAPNALDRLLGQLEASPGDATAPIAGRLLDRVRITPSGPGDSALLGRLHHLAGR